MDLPFFFRLSVAADEPASRGAPVAAAAERAAGTFFTGLGLVDLQRPAVEILFI
jgi:hypothetical protein